MGGTNPMFDYDDLIQRFKNKVRPPIPIFRALNRNKKKFVCPICDYVGPFADFHSFAGVRKHAVCPNCDSLERHRLQYLVVKDALKGMNVDEMTMLHFAPEKYLRPLFSRIFGKYETADLYMEGVDHKVDILGLPFKDGSYDFVFASHVLEHIADDEKAIQEIRRILKPNGLAILPVPVVCDKTIEYSEANPHEAGHVRAPGLDYYEKYKKYFRRVDVHASGSLPAKYQLFTYEDRSVWPTANCPLRPPMQGERHPDFVPVCFA
jgi:SAM-dependent methyltransferase